MVYNVIVCAIVDLRSSPTNPLGDAVEVLLSREDAERFIEEVRGDDRELPADRGAGAKRRADETKTAV